MVGDGLLQIPARPFDRTGIFFKGLLVVSLQADPQQQDQRRNIEQKRLRAGQHGAAEQLRAGDDIVENHGCLPDRRREAVRSADGGEVRKSALQALLWQTVFRDRFAGKFRIAGKQDRPVFLIRIQEQAAV